VLVMLDYDPKLPNAISKMLPVILGDIRPQLRQSSVPPIGTPCNPIDWYPT